MRRWDERVVVFVYRLSIQDRDVTLSKLRGVALYPANREGQGATAFALTPGRCTTTPAVPALPTSSRCRFALLLCFCRPLLITCCVTWHSSSAPFYPSGFLSLTSSSAGQVVTTNGRHTIASKSERSFDPFSRRLFLSSASVDRPSLTAHPTSPAPVLIAGSLLFHFFPLPRTLLLWFGPF